MKASVNGHRATRVVNLSSAGRIAALEVAQHQMEERLHMAERRLLLIRAVWAQGAKEFADI